MFYWQDLNLISVSYLQGVLNRNMAWFTTTVDMQDQKNKQPRRFWYHTIAFKASIMSQNRNNTHTHTPSERTSRWTRNSLGSFKTQNITNSKCFSYPKQFQINLDLPLACLKRLAEFHLNRAYIPQADLYSWHIWKTYTRRICHNISWKGESAGAKILLSLNVAYTIRLFVQDVSDPEMFISEAV